jgi:uncharacterized protein YecT (DUF1311 family)
LKILKALLVVLYLASINAYAACEEEKDGSTGHIACILSEQLKVEDNKLNLTYKKIVNALDQKNNITAKQKLIASEISWMKFRDYQCDLENEIIGGINGVSNVRCNLRLTKNRESELSTTFSEII